MDKELMKELLEAIANGMENWSDGTNDPGDMEILRVAATKIEEAADDKIDEILAENDWLPDALGYGAMILRVVIGRLA
jgi:hypothetical protein